MNQYLFSVAAHQIFIDGDCFLVEDADYSVMYDIHKISGRRIVMIDFKSVKRQVWKDMEASWVAAQVDAPILEKLEKRLQDQVDYEEEVYVGELMDELRRRA